MSELEKLGKVKVIEEIHIKFVHDKSLIWEEKLKLHLKPKPTWMPDKLWAKIVGMVLVQSSQR